MEHDNNEYNQNYSSGDCKSDAGTLASADNAILMDNNSGVDDTEEVKDDKDDKEGKDAITFLESSMDRSNIEQEALDSNRQYSLDNYRALPKEATTYELESFDKHALIIFNQEKIDGQKPRYGTKKDVHSLTKTFENFGFEVTTHQDLTKDALFDELEKFSEQDFTDYGCVAVAILTHGEIGRLHARDLLYDENDVIKYFKDYSKLTLVTKPKIFIIQSCRMMESSGQKSEEIRKVDAKDLEPYYILPLESDLLILHSTYPGQPSYRNSESGTWFIQALCKKIDTLSLTQDLESIVTEVKREVAIDKTLGEYEYEGTLIKICKQMPVMTSTLIRKLYLKKFDETYVDKSRWRSESWVLAEASSSRMTPLLDQFEPCSCVLEHFTYMRNCLRYFVAENPKDETAKGLLDVANTYDDSDDYNKPKDTMCKVISKHLMDKTQDSQIYKYLHFVPVERKVTKSKNAQKCYQCY